MSEPLSQVFTLLVLILINGMFSMTETAIVSARRARLQSSMENGDRRAKTTLDLIDHPNDLFSTIQIVISLIGVVTGAIGASTFSDGLAQQLAKVSFLKPIAASLAVLIISLLITFVSLVLGELIPKRIATNAPENIALAMGGPLNTLSKIFKPLVAILGSATNFGLRLLGIREQTDSAVSEDEIKVMIEQGKQDGVFEENEQDIVESVFRMSDRTVETLMTPRTDLVWIDLEDDLEESLQEILESTGHYFPLVRDDPDNVIGVISSKSLLNSFIRGEKIDLEAVAEQPLYVPQTKPALSFVDDLKMSDKNVAIVLDEYGGFLGMITPYELLNEIVGDVTTIGDDENEEKEVLVRGEGAWSFDAQIDIEQFKDVVEIRELPDELRLGYQTLAGFILSQMGRIPEIGDCFDWDKYHFEIVDMDGRRIDRVFVNLIHTKEDEEDS